MYTDRDLYEVLERVTACEEALNWAAPYGGITKAYDDCRDPDRLKWLLRMMSVPIDDNKIIVWACQCIRHTPLPFGKTVKDLLIDKRSIDVLEINELYVQGKASDQERSTAGRAAAEVIKLFESNGQHSFAHIAAAYAVTDLSWKEIAFVSAFASKSALIAAEHSVHFGVRSVMQDIAKAVQADLFKKVLGNPFS